jgi:hypothetical protein
MLELDKLDKLDRLDRLDKLDKLDIRQPFNQRCVLNH